MQELPIILLAVSLFVGQLLLSSPLKSASFDEQYDLAAGYAYVRTGDHRLAIHHPPLMNALAGLALLGEKELILPLEHSAWIGGNRHLFSDVFLWEANENPQRLIELGRRPIMVVGTLLVLAIYGWARMLWGARGAMLALALAVFDPNLVANARLITTDMGQTCFLFLAMWLLWTWLEDKRWWQLPLCGIVAGFAMSTKYTGLVFWFAAPLAMFLYPFQRANDGERKTSFAQQTAQRVSALFILLIIALGIVWALYGFSVGSFSDLQLVGLMPANVPPNQLVATFPLPAPFYWQELFNTYFRITDASESVLRFFMGQTSVHGSWLYFPVALSVKTPLPTLLLIGLGAPLTLKRYGWRRMSLLWAIPLIFLGLGLSAILTLGYRHLLPILPFLIVMAAGVVNWRPIAHMSRMSVVASVLLLVWLAGRTLWIHPHQEAHFNELAGQWINWSNILVDSNLDWGQDLPSLREIMDEHDIDHVNLAYFGKAVPEKYGIRYQPLPGYLRFLSGMELNAYNPYQPEPGWYAISATSLRLGLLQPESVDLYAYFRDLQPLDRAGYSIYLYHVSYPTNLPVEPASIVSTPVYALPPALFDDLTTKRTQIRWLKSPETSIIYAATIINSRAFVPPTAEPFTEVNVNFEQVFTLLGYTQEPSNVLAGQDVRLTFYWQVGPKPYIGPAPTRGRPLSTFVHVIDESSGQRIALYDGWETALRGLASGDVIVHPAGLRFDEEVAPGEYTILVGLYSPQTGTRLVSETTDGTADTIRAGNITIVAR